MWGHHSQVKREERKRSKEREEKKELMEQGMHCVLIQRVSEASEADSQSCSIEISDIYKYVYVRQNISPALLIT